MLKQLVAAVMGGILIAIGGCAYLNSLASAQLYIDTAVGAVLFAVAFILIAMKDYGLFTSRVGELPDGFTKEEASGLGMTLLGNVIGSFLIGSLVCLTMKEGLAEVAGYAVIAKLAAPWYLTLFRAVLCGILMQLASAVYKEKGTLLGFLFAVPAFLLAGLEHAVADMFFVAASGFFGEWKSIGLLLLVILGNTVGGVLFPLLTRLMKDMPKEEEEEPYVSIFEETSEEEAAEQSAEDTDAPEVEA